MQLEGIDHVALSVRDIDQSARWYIEVLGFTRLHAGVWGDVPTFVGTGTTAIALFPIRARNSNSEPSQIRMLHLAFRANRESFLAAQDELSRQGVRFEFQDHQIAHSIYFEDPDGHELEITTYDV